MTITHHRLSTAAPRWLAALPLLACLAVTTAFVSSRHMPWESSALLLQLFPILLVLGLPNVCLMDDRAARFVAILVGYQVWMLLEQLFNPFSLPCGWWRFAERSTALFLLLALLVARVEFRSWMQILGSATTCTLLISVVMNGYIGHLSPGDTNCFGFGHVNVLMNTATPALIGWAVLLWTDWREGRRPCARDLVMLTIGVALLAVQAVTTARRGAMLAVAAVIGAMFMLWLWRRNRPLAIGLVLIGVLGAGVMTERLFSQPIPTARNERIKIYRAAIGGLIESKGLGYGHYGTLRLQHISDENARHLTATGGFGFHAHQEILDQGLDGGVVAIILVLVASCMVALHILQLEDRSVRLAGLAIGVAVTTHAMTDNVYGTHVGITWLGVVVGALMGQPVKRVGGSSGRLRRWLPPIRMLAWPFVAVSAISVTWQIYPAVMHKDASGKVMMRSLANAYEPQTIVLYQKWLMMGEYATLTVSDKQEALRIASERVGWNGFNATFAAHFAKHIGTPEERVLGYLRLIEMSPFHKDAYQEILGAMQEHPEVTKLVPERIRTRVAYLAGDPKLPRPDLSYTPSDIDGAADLFAMTTWAIVNNLTWSELDRPMLTLVERYGDVPNIIGLIVQACSEAPPGTFVWLMDHAPSMELGFTTLIPYMIKLFNEVQTPQQAAGIYPLVARFFPDVAEDCRRGAFTPPWNEDSVPLRVSIIRLWALQRLYRPAPLAPIPLSPAPSP